MDVIATRSILEVSLRGLLSGRRWVVVAVLDAIFLVLVVILATAGSAGKGPEYLVTLHRALVLTVLLPFVCVLFATEALGGEVDDRTLIYLTLRPVPSSAIVVPKFVAAALISLAAVWVALVPGFVILAHGAGARMLAALLLSGSLEVIAYAAVFLVMGLMVRRSLLIGVIYVLFWEGAISSISQSAANYSIRHYALGLFSHLLRRPDLVSLDAGHAVPRSLVTLIVVTLGAVALAIYQLRRKELP